jgi:hypothetical protein
MLQIGFFCFWQEKNNPKTVKFSGYFIELHCILAEEKGLLPSVVIPGGEKSIKKPALPSVAMGFYI